MKRLLPLAALASLSCGTSMTPQGFCTELYGAFASFAQNCCSATDQMTPQYQGLSQAIQNLGLTCTQDLAQSVSQGRVRIDGAQADECLSLVASSLQAQGCGQLQAVSVETAVSLLCHDAVVGLQDTGRFCAADYECQAGLACVGFADGMDGICEVPPAVGASCGSFSADGGVAAEALTFGTHPDCGPGGWCSGTCVAEGAAGAACAADVQCELGLFCHLQACGSQGPAESGPCLSDSDCVTGEYCDPASGACTPQKTAGAACAPRAPPARSECFGLCNGGTCASWCGSY